MCPVDRLPVERGVTALVRGHAVAVFLMATGQIYVIGNHDPLDRTGTLGRGIVGSRDGVPFVGSTVHRRSFDLRSGHCLDDPAVRVPSYDVRVVDGAVQVGPRRDVG